MNTFECLGFPILARHIKEVVEELEDEAYKRAMTLLPGIWRKDSRHPVKNWVYWAPRENYEYTRII